ncbi:MAG: PhoH family protein, partial [Candidatus Sumerlaeota bacterium]|nr:PhoH family protein [Candidatus Sumerlaeota bacterium]
SHNAAGRFHRASGAILPLLGANEDLWGVRARNREQSFAIDLLLDDSVQVVTMAGKAGTGKTLLAIAAGLRKTADERAYAKMVVARPIMPLGKELGFLPGEVGEKLRPWMEPVYDNLEFLIQSHLRGLKAAEEKNAPAARRRAKRAGASTAEAIRQMHESGLLEVQPLTYIRGRSLPRQYLVIDEAQNLTVHEVKTIVTRAGEGTKVVLTGDPYQIDNPFLDSSSNGLSVAAERFKGKDLAGHIVLTHGERSPLAELASDLL